MECACYPVLPLASPPRSGRPLNPFAGLSGPPRGYGSISPLWNLSTFTSLYSLIPFFDELFGFGLLEFGDCSSLILLGAIQAGRWPLNVGEQNPGCGTDRVSHHALSVPLVAPVEDNLGCLALERSCCSSVLQLLHLACRFAEKQEPPRCQPPSPIQSHSHRVAAFGLIPPESQI